jgi:hypothetical protein
MPKGGCYTEESGEQEVFMKELFAHLDQIMEWIEIRSGTNPKFLIQVDQRVSPALSLPVLKQHDGSRSSVLALVNESQLCKLTPSVDLLF